jgi:hypothetical protein
MRLPDLRRDRATSLRTRVLLLIVAVFVAVAVPAYVAFEWIVKSTIIQLGTLFAEKQVLFDRYRGLDALLREVSLAETLVGSATMREWAADELSPDKRARALAELERFRAIFRDQLLLHHQRLRQLLFQRPRQQLRGRAEALRGAARQSARRLVLHDDRVRPGLQAQRRS